MSRRETTYFVFHIKRMIFQSYIIHNHDETTLELLKKIKHREGHKIREGDTIDIEGSNGMMTSYFYEGKNKFFRLEEVR